MEEKKLARELIALRPQAAPSAGPLVSIVVTNRDGEDHIQRLLHGLTKRTRYRSIELVLVDNGSSDRSRHVFDQWQGEKQLVANDVNQSFSVANNQGIRAASGELVLLANNDIEPLHPDWLGYMVESLEDNVAAVGAMLVYPKRPKGKDRPAHPDLTIQHLGVRFESSRWGVRGVNIGAGRDPRTIGNPDRHEVPGVTAACMLARRSDLLTTPFDEHYWYGSEDWDLCLQLSDIGKILVDERAVLFHHEFGTQDRFMSAAWLEGRTRNHQWFNDLWGPALRRKLRTEVTKSDSEWFFRGDRTPTVCVTSESEGRTQALAESLRQQALDSGWKVIEDEGRSSDFAIAVAPPRDPQWFAAIDMSVAVVVDQEGEWARSPSLDAATRILVPDHLGQTRLSALWGSDVAEIETGFSKADPALFFKLLAAAHTAS